MDPEMTLNKIRWKNGLPSVRPILLANGTPTNKPVKLLVLMIEPLTTNEHTIKNWKYYFGHTILL